MIEECNWLQALEGGIDTSHAPILHRLLTDSSKRGGIKPSNPFVRGKAPKLVVDITDYGYQYAGIRPLDGSDDVHIRTYHFIMPFHQIRPSRSESGLQLDAGHIWVPIDDENCMVYNWSYCPDGPLTEEDKLERGLGNGPLHVDPKTFRSKANRSNNYLLDREVQKTETYTGIDGINAQDRALQESMGAHRRSLEGASRPGRQGDHPGAQAAAPGGEDGRGRRHAGRHRHQLLHAARPRGGAAAQRRLARGVDAGDAERGDPADGVRSADGRAIGQRHRASSIPRSGTRLLAMTGSFAVDRRTFPSHAANPIERQRLD